MYTGDINLDPLNGFAEKDSHIHDNNANITGTQDSMEGINFDDMVLDDVEEEEEEEDMSDVLIYKITETSSNAVLIDSLTDFISLFEEITIVNISYKEGEISVRCNLSSMDDNMLLFLLYCNEKFSNSIPMEDFIGASDKGMLVGVNNGNIVTKKCAYLRMCCDQTCSLVSVKPEYYKNLISSSNVIIMAIPECDVVFCFSPDHIGSDDRNNNNIESIAKKLSVRLKMKGSLYLNGVETKRITQGGTLQTIGDNLHNTTMGTHIHETSAVPTTPERFMATPSRSAIRKGPESFFNTTIPDATPIKPLGLDVSNFLSPPTTRGQFVNNLLTDPGEIGQNFGDYVYQAPYEVPSTAGLIFDTETNIPEEGENEEEEVVQTSKKQKYKKGEYERELKAAIAGVGKNFIDSHSRSKKHNGEDEEGDESDDNGEDEEENSGEEEEEEEDKEEEEKRKNFIDDDEFPDYDISDYV